MTENFFSLTDLSQGIARELAPGVNTHVFAGDQAMLSVVELAPNAKGSIHSHPEEQWGLMLAGSGVRIQGGVDHPVKAGDFWRTPGAWSMVWWPGSRAARCSISSPPARGL